jgi:hypothetical protein
LKKSLLIFLILVVTNLAYAQQPLPDSIFNNAKAMVDSLPALNKADSLRQKLNATQNRWSNKLDSLRSLGNLERYKDSLIVIGWADSLRQKVSTTFTNMQNALQSEIDSLLIRNQPTLPFQQKVDSLQNKQQALLNEVDAKQNQLQQKINTRYQKWGSKLDSMGLKIPNSDLNNLTQKAKASNVPALSLVSVGTQLPTTTLPIGLPNINAPALPNLDSHDFSTLNLSKELSNVGGELSVPGADQMKQWNDQLKNVSNPLEDVTSKWNDAKDVFNDPGKAVEEAAKQVKDVNALSEEMSNADKLLKENEAMRMAELMKDPEKMKEEAAKNAINHFAGKEAVVKQAVDQMAKIKQKVPSLESLDKLPKNYKWPKNGLKGRPFRERIRWGMNFGVQERKDSIVVDLFPNVSYNLTGRVEFGAGMIYRLRESTKTWQFDQAHPVWGFNMFGTCKAVKSVRLRVEADAASYPKLGVTGEPIERKWRWTWLAGLQTEFKISRHFTGNVQMLHNFDKSLTAGFPEQLVLRFGVQYKFLSKKSK